MHRLKIIYWDRSYFGRSGCCLGAGKCGSLGREVGCGLNVQVLSAVESDAVVLCVLTTAYISR